MAFGADDLVVAPAAPARPVAFGANDDVAGGTVPNARRATSMYEAFVAGMQDSATGLAARRKLPDVKIDRDSPWQQRFAAGAGGIIVDLPLSTAGAVAGFIGGGAAGTAVAGPPGTVTGGVVGAGAVGMGVPMAVREALIQAYSNNYALSWKGAWEAAKAGAKGAIIGGATAGAGRAAGSAWGRTTSAVGPVVPAIKGSMAREVAVTSAELATLTAAASALEGQMPTLQDFMDNALLLGGQKAAIAAARRMTPGTQAKAADASVRAVAEAATRTPEQISRTLQHVFAETGKTPDVVVGEAQRDPQLKSELTGEPNFQGWTVEQLQADFAKKHPQVTFELARGDDGRVHIDFIEAKPTKEGLGSMLLADFTRWLDENQVESGLVAVAMGDTPLSKVIETYQRFGYKVVNRPEDFEGGGVPMVRLPNKDIQHAATNTQGQSASRVHEASDRAAQEGTRTSAIPRTYDGLALEQRVAAALGTDPRSEVIRQSLAEQESLAAVGQSVHRDTIKYEYITDRETAVNVMRAVAAEYQAEISAQTRGIVADRKTSSDGMRLVASGALPERAIGSAANSAELFARAHLLRGAANSAVETANRYNEIPPGRRSVEDRLEVRAALERVALLNAEFSGAAAEAGRALRILNVIKRDPSYLGDANLLLAEVQRGGSIDDIAGIVGGMKDKTPAAVAALSSKLTKATTIQKVLEAWRAFILSGPMTHMANVIGNSVKWAVDIPESALAATFTQVGRAASGQPLLTAQQFKARAFAPLIGIQLGAVDSIKVAAEVWKQKGEHLEKADQYQKAIEGPIGDVVRLPFRFLQVEDALFRTVAERAKAYELAVDRAVKEGIDPRTREWHESIHKWITEPELGLSEKDGLKAIEIVEHAGAEAVFAQRLSPFLEKTQAAMMQHAPAAGFVVPFIRTPANLTSWSIQHAPGLNLMSGRWRADFAAGGERRAKALARVVIGAGLMLGAYAAAREGLITGSGQLDKEEGGTKRGAGWQPYSLNIDGTYYSYQRLEPVGKLLGLAADIMELMDKSDNEEDKLKLGLMAVGLFGNATVSTTYLSGLSNAMQSITDPTRYAPNFIEQYASSVVPKIVGQTTMMFDPDKREVDGAVDAIASQLPYFRQKLLPKIDVWGERSPNTRLFKVLPIASSPASKDKVKSEAMRLEFAISDVPQFIYESGPFSKKDQRIKLTGEQRNVMREVSGKFAMSILEPIVNAPDWTKIPDFSKKQIYDEALKSAREYAANTALPQDAPERDKVRQKILDKVLKQSEEADRR